MKTAPSRRRFQLMVLTSLAILALLLPSVAFAAPVTPAAESAPSSSGCAAWHFVRHGETLSEIARLYGVSQQAIMSANGISNPNRVLAGSTLCIPFAGGWQPPSGNCVAWHSVQRGETLSQIALWYGVSMWDVMQANNILNANHIWVGQNLCIPGGGVAPQPPGPCTGIHVVRVGDTLTRIAGWYGTTVQNLMWLNGLSNPNHIWVGQRLVVPCGTPPPVDPCPCPPPVQPPPPPICCPSEPPPVTGSWFGEFFNNRDLAGASTFNSTFSQVGFNWGYGGPGNGVGNDNFSARFTQEQWLAGGTYRFYVTSDDGVRVWVNDVLVIDGWRVQSAENYYIGDFHVADGNARIRIEYFEAEGQAILFASFARQ